MIVYLIMLIFVWHLSCCHEARHACPCMRTSVVGVVLLFVPTYPAVVMGCPSGSLGTVAACRPPCLCAIVGATVVRAFGRASQTVPPRDSACRVARGIPVVRWV